MSSPGGGNSNLMAFYMNLNLELSLTLTTLTTILALGTVLHDILSFNSGVICEFAINKISFLVQKPINRIYAGIYGASPFYRRSG